MPIQFKGLLFILCLLVGIKISTCQHNSDTAVVTPTYTFNDSLIQAVQAEEACQNDIPQIAEISEPVIIPEPEPVQPKLPRRNHYRKSTRIVVPDTIEWDITNPYHPTDIVRVDPKVLHPVYYPNDTLREIVVEGYPRQHVERMIGKDSFNQVIKPDLKWEYAVFDSFRIAYCLDYGALNVYCNGELQFEIPPLNTPSAETSRYKTGNTTELIELTNADAVIHIIRYQQGYSEAGNVWLRIFDKNSLDAGNVTPSWQGGDIYVFKLFIGPED